METSELSADEVCSIIKTCSEAQVASLKFRGLEIVMQKDEPVLDLRQFQTQNTNQYPVAEITGTQHQKLNEEAIEHEELQTREEQLRELALTDPLAFEELQMQGDLEGTDDEPSDVPEYSE